MSRKTIAIALAAALTGAGLTYFAQHGSISAVQRKGPYTGSPATRPPPTFGPAAAPPPGPPAGAGPDGPRPHATPSAPAPGQPNTVVAAGPPCLGITDPNVLSACLTAEDLSFAEWERMVQEAQGQQPPDSVQASTQPPASGGGGLLGAMPGLIAGGPIGSALGIVTGPVLGNAIPVASPVIRSAVGVARGAPSFAANGVRDVAKNPLDFGARQAAHISKALGTAVGGLGGAVGAARSAAGGAVNAVGGMASGAVNLVSSGGGLW